MSDDESSAYEGARNQDLGRKINDRIELRSGPDQANKTWVVCECSDGDCEVLIELTLEQYQRIRAADSHFVVVAGHESPDLERIVAREGKWLTVQKIGEARTHVEEMDTP
jgi:hypothetical protein